MSLAVTQGIDKDQNVLFFQNIPKLEVPSSMFSAKQPLQARIPKLALDSLFLYLNKWYE